MPKVKDERKTVKKVEFRDAGPIVKHFDCRVMYSSHPVTKAYAERKKRDPIFDAFGIGGGADAIRGNAHITMLHRDNVWHPYYEIQMEEDNLANKIRDQQAKKPKNIGGSEVADLEKDLAQLVNTKNEEEKQPVVANQKGKRVFDPKAF